VEETIYYRRANGAYTMRTVSASSDVPVVDPEGAVRITQAEYEQGVAAAVAVRDQAREQRQAAETQSKKGAYDALVAAGIPDAAAQTLSGYVPEQEPDGGTQ
jgi:hypothetical protein